MRYCGRYKLRSGCVSGTSGTYVDVYEGKGNKRGFILTKNFFSVVFLGLDYLSDRDRVLAYKKVVGVQGTREVPNYRNGFDGWDIISLSGYYIYKGD